MFFTFKKHSVISIGYYWKMLGGTVTFWNPPPPSTPKYDCKNVIRPNTDASTAMAMTPHHIKLFASLMASGSPAARISLTAPQTNTSIARTKSRVTIRREPAVILFRMVFTWVALWANASAGTDKELATTADVYIDDFDICFLRSRNIL